MKNYNKEDALKIIINAAIEYEERLRDNHFLIIYSQNNKISAVQVGFRDSNYLHMTGVKSRLSAPVFYDSCIKKKLSERDFEFDKNGRVQQKLMVLPYLPDLLYNNCMVGDFINSGICIKADKQKI